MNEISLTIKTRNEVKNSNGILKKISYQVDNSVCILESPE